MSGNHKGLFFQAEMLAPMVTKALAGKMALYGTGVGQIVMTMPEGQGYTMGETVKVPYFTSLGDAEDLTGDQQALSPDAISSAVELATVQHSGKAFSATKWAQWNALGNPYALCSNQLANIIARRFDKALLDAAVSPLAGNANVTDVSASGTDALLSHDNLLEARSKWGDETDDIACIVVHSQVEKALRKLKDSTGRPLITDMVNGELNRFNGIPIKVSDKMPFTGSGPSAVYTSLLCKKNALVVWTNGAPRFRQAEDALADADLAAMHFYWAAHRYINLDGGTKTGIQIIKHLAPLAPPAA